MAGKLSGQPTRFHRLKADFLDAFYHEKLRGVEGLVEWATDPEHPENKATFYKMVVSILPKELNVTGENGGPIRLTDTERITKLQYVIAALERMAKMNLEKITQVSPEPLLIETTAIKPSEDQVPRPRAANLVHFVKKIESARQSA
jgi:hypothetical protein